MRYDESPITTIAARVSPNISNVTFITLEYLFDNGSILEITYSLSDIEMQTGLVMVDTHVREYYMWRFRMLQEKQDYKIWMSDETLDNLHRRYVVIASELDGTDHDSIKMMIFASNG